MSEYNGSSLVSIKVSNFSAKWNREKRKGKESLLLSTMTAYIVKDHPDTKH